MQFSQSQPGGGPAETPGRQQPERPSGLSETAKVAKKCLDQAKVTDSLCERSDDFPDGVTAAINKIFREIGGGDPEGLGEQTTEFGRKITEVVIALYNIEEQCLARVTNEVETDETAECVVRNYFADLRNQIERLTG